MFDVRVGKVIECRPFQTKYVLTVYLGQNKYITIMQEFRNISPEELRRGKIIYINTIILKSMDEKKNSVLIITSKNMNGSVEELIRPHQESVVGEKVCLNNC